MWPTENPIKTIDVLSVAYNYNYYYNNILNVNNMRFRLVGGREKSFTNNDDSLARACVECVKFN